MNGIELKLKTIVVVSFILCFNYKMFVNRNYENFKYIFMFCMN